MSSALPRTTRNGLVSHAVITVWRHYAARFSRAFAAAFAILALLLIAVDAMLHLASLFEQAPTAAAALRLLIERAVGAYLEHLMPVAAFVAAFWCAGSASLQREVLALKASGISPLVALAPMLVLAVAIAALHLAAAERLGVPAAAALAARKNPAGGDVRARAGSVWYHAGRVVYSVQELDPTTGAVHGIQVYERDSEGRLLRTIHAAHGERIAPQRWQFTQARVREFDPRAPAAPPREQHSERIVLELASDRSPRLSRGELAGMPLATLRGIVANGAATGAEPGAAQLVLNNRLSSPLSVLLFAALAIPLALRSEERRSLARAALQGAALLVAFFLARDYGGSFAARSSELAAVFPWLTLGAFALVGAFAMRRVAT